MCNFNKKKMKTIDTVLIAALGAFLMTACQNDDAQAPSLQSGETTQVAFELDASSLKHNPATRTYTPSYGRDGFSIYAFKKTGDSYVYSKAISLNNMTYSADTKKLTGTDNLAIGTYKFLPAYGIANQTSRITPPNWSGATLTDNLSISFNATTPMTEIFLDTDGDAASLTSYDFGITETPNQTVSATLKRSVARVDLMFLSATIENGEFVEKPYHDPARNIFDGKTLEKLELRFTDANNMMTLFGTDATVQRTAQTFNLSNFSETVVIGNATATSVGKDDYTGYDNIQSEDIIAGGAHVFGTYLFPNDDASKTTGLQLFIKPQNEEGRTITISKDDATKLPLERNKVTIVKVYVLNNNNVFSTTVDFEVEIETVWEDANEVIGSIS